MLHRYYTLGKIDFLTPSKKIPVTSSAPYSYQIPPDQETTALKHSDLKQDHQTIMVETEKKLILKALELHQWNRKKSAAHTGIPLRSFYRKLKQYRIIQKD